MGDTFVGPVRSDQAEAVGALHEAVGYLSCSRVVVHGDSSGGVVGRTVLRTSSVSVSPSTVRRVVGANYCDAQYTFDCGYSW